MHRSRPRDECGSTATEYALLIAGIAAVIVLAIFVFGDTVLAMFDDTCTRIAETGEQIPDDACVTGTGG